MRRLTSALSQRLNSALKTRSLQLTAVVGFSVLTLACQVTGADSQNLLNNGMPQYLPVEAIAVIQGKNIALEVALTPEQQALGLMHRQDLGAERGMLFPFDPPRPAAFWMKNTLIPLDIIFLRQQKVVTIHHDVPPCKIINCPSYPSAGAVDQVIELEAGRAEALGLQKGDRIDVHFLADPEPSNL